MSSQTVARRYATALADVVVPHGEPRAIQDELIAWELMIQSNPQLQEVFANPTIPYDQKRAVIRELVARTEIHPFTANFLQTLLKNQRLTVLSEINKRLAQLLDERAGVVAVYVTTARPIAEETRRALSQNLETLTGKRVRLSFATDDELIGGMVTRVGSTIYDGSIRSQLKRLEQVLTGQ